jgi:hypothetical protein
VTKPAMSRPSPGGAAWTKTRRDWP